MKHIRAIILTTALLLGAGGIAVSASPAHASNNGVQICNYTIQSGFNTPRSPCFDNYSNGGPLVKSYAPGNTWEDFYLQFLSNGDVEIVDASTGYCVGDSGNNQYSALAGGYDSCPSSGTAGWGTVFAYETNGCTGGVQGNGGVLYNFHWNGDIDVPGSGNGQQYYLNTGGIGHCYFSFN
jgi:hypothetical protein